MRIRRSCAALLVSVAACFAAPPTLAAETPQEEIARQVPAALAILDKWHAVDPVPARRVLHVVYWTPADREPAPEYQARLSRVLLDVRDFYLSQMKGLGLGDRTIHFAMEPEKAGQPPQVKIHVVTGAKPYAAYDGKSGSDIRKESLPTLKAAGLEPDKETIVFFCNMSNWDAERATMTQNSPYYAGGSLRGGNAWQVDSPLLDSALLGKKEPVLTDGQYGKISVGKYNSIFVGGVCHELGHALSLPHNSERPDQREAFGTALMGGGNRTYGDDRRGEGRGSFLTLAEGLRLASHPIFNRSAKGIDLPANAKLDDVTITLAADKKTFTFAAKVTADPPAYAVVGYMDPAGGSDYDAPTCTAVPDKDGRFTLRCDALKAGKPGVLRVVVCQANGGRINDKTLAIPYDVAADGTVDLSAYTAGKSLAGLVKAANAKDADATAAELAKVEAVKPDERTLAAARTLAATVTGKPGPPPVDATGAKCSLSDAASLSARVGWGKPTANRLPGDGALIKAGGRLFARGLYAHAPSGYKYDLGGKWTTLRGRAGVADGFDGSVVFVVLGDDKELWRSGKSKGEALLDLNVDVTGVKVLELRVENSGDGNSGDWAVWVEPTVERAAP